MLGFASLWIWAVAYSTNMILRMHQMGLHQIQRL